MTSESRFIERFLYSIHRDVIISNNMVPIQDMFSNDDKARQLK